MVQNTSNINPFIDEPDPNAQVEQQPRRRMSLKRIKEDAEKQFAEQAKPKVGTGGSTGMENQPFGGGPVEGVLPKNAVDSQMEQMALDTKKEESQYDGFHLEPNNIVVMPQTESTNNVQQQAPSVPAGSVNTLAKFSPPTRQRPVPVATPFGFDFRTKAKKKSDTEDSIKNVLTDAVNQEVGGGSADPDYGATTGAGSMGADASDTVAQSVGALSSGISAGTAGLADMGLIGKAYGFISDTTGNLSRGTSAVLGAVGKLGVPATAALGALGSTVNAAGAIFDVAQQLGIEVSEIEALGMGMFGLNSSAKGKEIAEHAGLQTAISQAINNGISEAQAAGSTVGVTSTGGLVSVDDDGNYSYDSFETFFDVVTGKEDVSEISPETVQEAKDIGISATQLEMEKQVPLDVFGPVSGAPAANAPDAEVGYGSGALGMTQQEAAEEEGAMIGDVSDSGGFGDGGPEGDSVGTTGSTTDADMGYGGFDSGFGEGDGGGGDGGGDGGDGGTYICTAIYNSGRINDMQFKKLCIHGKNMRKNHPNLMRFYDLVGPRIADKTDKNKIVTKFNSFLVDYLFAEFVSKFDPKQKNKLTFKQKLFSVFLYGVYRPLGTTIGFTLNKLRV